MRWDEFYQVTVWEFSQDTRVNTPTLTINAMGSLMTSESGHPFNVPSERRHPTQCSVPNHCPGALEYLLGQRKECFLLALQHHFQQHLVSHPGTDQDQPCLVCRVVCCWLEWHFIVPSTRCTCAMIMFNQLLDMQYQSGGWIILAKDKMLTNRDVNKFVHKI